MRTQRSLWRLLALGASLFVVAPIADAQPNAPDEIRGVVTGLFDAMRARDTAAMRAAFDSTATLHSLGPRGVTTSSVADWLRSVASARPGVVLDERLGEQLVQVDGALATVWVRYHFYVGENFSHCGVDAFVLARTGDRWRVISVADTRQREGCAPLT